MPALITSAITENNFEKVRDQIGVILSLELANQSTLIGDSKLNPDIYIERIVNIDFTETAVVNISFSNGSYDMSDVTYSDGTYSYFIDVYCSEKSSGTLKSQQGGTVAMIRLQRILGLIRSILMNPVYLRLGFTAPSIEHREVSNISIADPSQIKDAANGVMGRITFSVRVPENSVLKTANNIAGFESSVKLELTDKGYMFSNFTT